MLSKKQNYVVELSQKTDYESFLFFGHGELVAIFACCVFLFFFVVFFFFLFYVCLCVFFGGCSNANSRNNACE